MCVIVVTMRGWADVGLWVAVCFLAKISLHRPACKITFARLTQSQAISQSFRAFITFRSMRDTTFFHFSKLFFCTVIHSSTLGIQRKVTKLSCFWYPLFRTQFQHFLGVFWRSFFAVQLALVSMITITLISSLSVFSLQRTRLFRTRREQGRTRGEQGLYFGMLRRLDLSLFSWLSHWSREAKNWACRGQLFMDWSIDYLSPAVTLDGHCSVLFQSIFKPKMSLEDLFLL